MSETRLCQFAFETFAEARRYYCRLLGAGLEPWIQQEHFWNRPSIWVVIWEEAL